MCVCVYVFLYTCISIAFFLNKTESYEKYFSVTFFN